MPAFIRITRANGGAALGTPPGAAVSGTSTAITSAAYASLAFNSADTFDTDGFHDPSSKTPA